MLHYGDIKLARVGPAVGGGGGEAVGGEVLDRHNSDEGDNNETADNTRDVHPTNRDTTTPS